MSDLMETDLHRIIYSKQPLSLDHIQYFIYQVHTLLFHVLATQHNTTQERRDLPEVKPISAPRPPLSYMCLIYELCLCCVRCCVR